MRSTIKKLFDWTPRDVAYWERIRQKGLGRFVVVYGLLITGCVLFVVFGLITVLGWLRGIIGFPNPSFSLTFLVFRLLITALVCLAGGVINSLITWTVEERLYRKYKAGK